MSHQTILLVDDEEPQRKRMRTILRNAGYAVIESRDYAEAEAIHQRRGEEIDLLLIDVSLPGKNGCELAKTAMAVQPGVKVLLMSGHAGAEVCRFYGIPATDVHFLAKPFRSAELLLRVRSLLAANGPLTETASA